LFDLLLLGAVDSEKYCVFVSKFSCYLGNRIFGEILVRLSQIYRSMRIRTVFSEPAHLVVFIKLALLRLVVVVRDVEQFKLHFYRQRVHLHQKITKTKSLRLLCVAAQNPRARSGRPRPSRSALSA